MYNILNKGYIWSMCISRHSLCPGLWFYLFPFIPRSWKYLKSLSLLLEISLHLSYAFGARNECPHWYAENHNWNVGCITADIFIWHSSFWTSHCTFQIYIYIYTYTHTHTHNLYAKALIHIYLSAPYNRQVIEFM